MSVDQLLIWEYYKVLGNIMAETKWRFEKMSNDFDFHFGYSLSVMLIDILKKCTTDLAIKCHGGIDTEIINEIEFF